MTQTKKKAQKDLSEESFVRDDFRRRFVLGENRWWLGVIILIFIVTVFSVQFIDEISVAISDPLYLFSVITVGIAIAAPILWILNEGRLMFNRNIDRRSEKEKELFEELISLPEDFYVFQNIKIGGQRFDNLVVGDRSLTIITMIKKGEMNSKEVLDRETERAEGKIKVLKRELGDGVPVYFLLVKAEDRDDLDGAESNDGRVISVPMIEDKLKESNRSGDLLSSEVGEKLKYFWERQ